MKKAVSVMPSGAKMFSAKYWPSERPGHLFNHEAEHVETETIVPYGARLVQQWKRGKRVEKFAAGHGHGSRAAARRIELVHGGIAARAVDQPAGVHHQMTQRDRPGGRLAGDRAGRVQLGNLHLGKLRKILRQRVVDQQLAALLQLQRRERDDWLGHRRDVEDRVLRHRNARRPVAETERLLVDELALAHDRDHGAGQAAFLNVGVDDRRDAAEPFGGQADFLGLAAR
jgi:hypothetical protein